MRRALFISIVMAGRALGEGDAARGKELFVTCAGCHSATTDQRKTGPSLRSLFGRVTLHNGSHADDENVRRIVLDGYNGMPPFRYSFRPAEIDDLMAYLHTLTAKPPQAEASAGATYFKAYCVSCHNPDSRTSRGPDLRGHYKPEWLEIVNGGHAEAPPLKEWLDAAAREVLAEYLKTY